MCIFFFKCIFLCLVIEVLKLLFLTKEKEKETKRNQIVNKLGKKISLVLVACGLPC